MTAVLIDGRTAHTPAGDIDLVAVERWLRGADIPLTHAERVVAAKAAADAGMSLNALSARLRCRDSTVRHMLDSEPAVDRRGIPLHTQVAS